MYVNEFQRNTVIVSAVNAGYVEMALNWLESIQRAGINVETIIYALDPEAYRKLEMYGVDTLLWEGDTFSQTPPKLATFRSDDWNKIMYQRIEIVNSLLLSGQNVLFSDCDIVFLNNPIPYFAEVTSKGYELLFQSDWGGDYDTLYRLCAGFYFAIPSKKTIELLTVAPENAINSDQYYFNEILGKSGKKIFSVYILPIDKFPNGRYWSQKKADTKYPYIVHYNWVKGVGTKFRQMINDGHWYTSKTPEELSPEEMLNSTHLGLVSRIICKALRKIIHHLEHRN